MIRPAGEIARSHLHRKVLQKDPDNADALHLLGVLAHERGRQVRAI